MRWPAYVVLLAVGVACDPSTTATTPPDSPQPSESPPSSSEEDQHVVLLRGGKVMTGAKDVYAEADILVRGSTIEAIGPHLDPPDGADTIDVRGKVITPGLIDTHSHIGVYPTPGLHAHDDGNEAVAPVTAYARAEDGYWPQDPEIDRARAGGITTLQILPGSANLIGGRSVVVKTYLRARTVGEARFEGAPYGLKMACGENPKRVHGDKGGPATRMGNLAGMRKAFAEAQSYARAQARYRDELKAYKAKSDHKSDEPPPSPPDWDAGLETLAAVMDGEILIHNHCYRADDMAQMLELSHDFGFSIRSFHHAIEAYKIADLLAQEGVGASVWADWWGFKAEAYDAIKENAPMLTQAGAKVMIHSDSGDGIQRLNQEAAKALYAGQRAGLGTTEVEALQWITANPAWALGIDDQVGTLEPGKQADLVVWNGPIFSVYARAERVYIEGHLVYDIKDAQSQSDFEIGHVEDMH